MEICDVNKPMDPIGTASALAAMNEEPGSGARPVEIQDSPSSSTSDAPSGGIQVKGLFDDDLPVTPEPNETPSPQPLLDAPAPETLSPAGSPTVS